jgi:hypothetical protein
MHTINVKTELLPLLVITDFPYGIKIGKNHDVWYLPLMVFSCAQEINQVPLLANIEHDGFY